MKKFYQMLLPLLSLLIAGGFSAEFHGKCTSCPSSFLEGKISVEDKRYSTFSQALKLLQARHAKVIVETGTSRSGNSNCLGDGCSTLIFGEWARRYGGKLYSIDVSQYALDEAARHLGETKDFVELVCSDSVAFLENFNQTIDFLYLDSYDFDINNPLPSQNHHLREIIAAYPWLTKDSVVMIDDCGLPYGGKGKRAIQYLLVNGWRVIAKGYQVIMVKL